MRIGLTGGIACGKSLLSHFLNARGMATIDADDIVHELIPDPAERKRIAAEVFADPEKRKALEARLHPLVRARIKETIDRADHPVIAIVPLLFEVQWDADYDIIVCVVSTREQQIARMMTTRGYTREEAEARLAAQMPVEAKALKSHYVITNNGSAEDLEREVERFIAWLDHRMNHDKDKSIHG